MTLFARASNNISFAEALEECSGILLTEAATGLFYTPTWCGFVEIGPTAGDWIVSPKDRKRFDPKLLFEARVFNKNAELRWLKDWPNKGRAALLSDIDISGYLAQDAGRIAEHGSLDQHYLLWGEGIEAANGELPYGWSRLATARIGTLDVAFPGVKAKGERIQLLAREYLDVDDYGNVSVAEERLVRLARHDEGQDKTGK